MGIQEPKFDLHEMQMYFEREIRDARTISDLELSENDYRRLGIQLKSLYTFANNSNFADAFMLCTAVYWTYSYLYWDEKYAKFNGDLVQTFYDLSQYTQRHQLVMFLECFHDFGLHCYPVATDDLMKACERITARHAGIPNDEQELVFDLVNRYLSVESDTAWNAIQPWLPKKTRHIMASMDQQMQITVVDELQKLLMAVENHMTEEALLEAFPDLSRLLILNCVNWHENQELKTYGS